jgi:hypothetical protein
LIFAIDLLQLSVDIGAILGLITTALFIVFVVFGQRLQYRLALGSIGRSMERLGSMKERAKKETVEYFVNAGKAAGDVEGRVTQFLDYVAIMPTDLDPSGIVQKIGHISDTGDERIRTEVREMMDGADAVTVSIAQNLLELSSALNMIHKLVRHFYISGRKTRSPLALSQLDMAMPQVMEQAVTLQKAIDSIRLGQPVGDGIGPLVASRYIGKAAQETIAKDTTLTTLDYQGRTLYVVKAEGPNGYVGQPGLAIQKVVGDLKIPISSIIMVDAALKLEGEKTGEVAEGVGAAIGGLGVEKFQIEEVASKHRIPLYAILVKESDVEAITTMKQEIVDAVPRVMSAVSRIIEQRTKAGESVLLAGIGNTLGIGQ